MKILYGAGTIGKLQFLLLGSDAVYAFIDKNKHGETYCKKPVLHPCELTNLSQTHEIILCVDDKESVYAYLKTLGITVAMSAHAITGKRETLRNYFDRTLPILEIGPLDRPFLSKRDYNVFYADIEDADHVRRIYGGDPAVGEVVDIDYVVESTYAQAVGAKRFQALFSSHVIEHTHDIIRHLQETGDILIEGGFYVLFIPDKRFTFDYFREITPFRDAYAVYRNGTTALGSLAMDAAINTPYPLLLDDIIEAQSSSAKMLCDRNRVSTGLARFDDIFCGSTHFWIFTFPSFLALFRDCLRFNLLPFTLEYAALSMGEFHVVLKKTTAILHDEEFRQKELLKTNARIYDA